MSKFFGTLRDVWKMEDLRGRLLLTLLILFVYRVGAHIVLPGIDSEKLAQLGDRASGGGLLDILNAFTGGAFANASVFALGIMPYISASIVVQLMSMTIPYLQKMQNEGESGRRTTDQITRWLTIGICLVQAPTYLYSLTSLGVPQDAFLMGMGLGFVIPSVVILVSGTLFAMWLGEKITEKGIGNGISLLIMVGIIARLPRSFAQEFVSRVSENNGGVMLVLVELVVWLVVVLLCILLVMAVRRVPVQYARRMPGGGIDRSSVSSRQYIPLKLNSSGVMPIIFAQAVMFVPGLMLGMFSGDTAQFWKVAFSDVFGFWYNMLFALLIIVFTYLYTAVAVPTGKMSEGLRRNGGFVPGVKPGADTSKYLDGIMSLLVLPGSLFLALIAILPAITMKILGVQQGWALFYGGTSLLIMVGVAIDTMDQVGSFLLNRRYDGLMKVNSKRVG